VLTRDLELAGKEANRSVEEHPCPKPFEKMQKGVQEGKSKKHLAI